VTTPEEADLDLVDDIRRIWDAKADFWDERMGEGNKFQRELIGPALERLLLLRPGERVLDIGCGNGVFTRRLAQLGARVTGTDVSERFIERAAARATPFDELIDYQVVDATDATQLLALGEEGYDAVICSMVLMDIPVIAPLLSAARRLLTGRGRFVFAVPHPAFNNNSAELTANAGTGLALQVTNYLDIPAGKGAGMPGEPEPHWYFHRPLHELLGGIFAAGYVLDSIEEPRFATPNEHPGATAWDNLAGIPPVLAARAVVTQEG
jgi:2-polyprenyl-3-methyl-5-hydroxy-6-metoxy-1,4-benzoquinol methylase